MIMSLKQRKIKFEPRIKIEPQHTHKTLLANLGTCDTIVMRGSLKSGTSTVLG